LPAVDAAAEVDRDLPLPGPGLDVRHGPIVPVEERPVGFDAPAVRRGEHRGMVAGTVAAAATPGADTGGMDKRKWYPTKAAWASARARELRAEAQRIRAQSIPAAQWRRVQGKMRALNTILERIAAGCRR